ncbi:hypothetical protein KY348_04100 [Candidatus Woesearchaeota archaeon]|nr:hypothetical protein [Candidatus Woesearchaeota archaeon]
MRIFLVTFTVLVITILSQGCLTPQKAQIDYQNYEVISSDARWDASNNPHIVEKSIIVSGAATLTIEPGVVVKFGKGKELIIEGRLNARGGPENYITFTSNTANGCSPSAPWKGVRFLGVDISLSYLNISCSEKGVFGRVKSFEISNSIFSQNQGSDIYLRGIKKQSSIFNNKFINGKNGIKLQGIRRFVYGISRHHHPAYKENNYSALITNVSIVNNDFRNYETAVDVESFKYDNTYTVISRNNFSNCVNAIRVEDQESYSFISYNSITNSTYGFFENDNDRYGVSFNDNIIKDTDYCVYVNDADWSRKFYYNNKLYCNKYAFCFTGKRNIKPKIYNNSILSPNTEYNNITSSEKDSFFIRTLNFLVKEKDYERPDKSLVFNILDKTVKLKDLIIHLPEIAKQKASKKS